MDAIGVVVGVIAGLAIGVAFGVVAGRWTSSRAGWLFWLLALAVVAVGTAVSALGAQIGQDVVLVGGVAFMAGALTSLKYASRRIPGLGGQ